MARKAYLNDLSGPACLNKVVNSSSVAPKPTLPTASHQSHYILEMVVVPYTPQACLLRLTEDTGRGRPDVGRHQKSIALPVLACVSG